MTDREWDKKLGIDTIGRDANHEDEYHHAYEPTPYSVLERLAGGEYITEENVLVDYGCGKGRVGFFMNYMTRCKSIGIEYDEHIFEQAKKNLVSYGHKADVILVNEHAENYEIKEADSFFFFNPFSIEILRSVLGRIIESYYADPRVMTMFFYYPDEEYVSYLMTQNEVMFVDEIDCQDLFEGNNERERILIFEVGY